MVPTPPDPFPSKSSIHKGDTFGKMLPIQHASELLKLVSNPYRLRILLILEDTDQNVSGLLAKFSGVTDQFVSRHLGILRRNGLVEDHVAGTFRVYSLTGAGRRLVQAIQSLIDP